MSQATTGHSSSLVRHWFNEHQDSLLGVVRKGRRVARTWSFSALDRSISAATIVLLAPAIFAVWIAIRRSAPQQSLAQSTAQLPGHAPQLSIIGQGQNDVLSKPPVILTIKPARQAISA
jgi:hypothetical protein